MAEEQAAYTHEQPVGREQRLPPRVEAAFDELLRAHVSCRHCMDAQEHAPCYTLTSDMTEKDERGL